MYTYSATITRWIDGDTVKAVLDLGFSITVTETFRIVNINAPEMNTQGGPAAKAFAESLLPPNSVVLIQTFKKDKYGRWLADFPFLDGTTLSERMVKNGHVVPYMVGM